MNKLMSSCFIFVVLSMQGLAQAAEDLFILPLVTCQSSWLDWVNDPVKKQQFQAHIRTNFRQDGSNGSFLPIVPITVLGQNVSRVYPESVGMGLGFSVVMDARSDLIKSALHKSAGKPLGQCAKEEGLSSCQLEIAPKKTLMSMEINTGKTPQTLVGCYYYYQK